MGDDEDSWKSLSTVAKVQHGQWKARLQGYTEAKKLFTSQDSENATVFNEYVGLIKKFVLDANAIAQENGLDATLAFLENANVATKCAPDVAAALVSKGLSAARAKTKDKAVECMLQIVEIERHEAAFEELLKGLTNKNPKLVVGCLQTLREIINLFGPKVVQLKSLVKEFPRLFDDRDKNVRNETKNLVVEVCRWLGPAHKTILTDVKPVVLNEITALLDELPSEKPTPQRFLKSQKPKVDSSTAGGDAVTAGGAANGSAAVEDEVDVDDLIVAADVLPKIPSEYWSQITEKKWQDRQAALESIDKLTDVPKIVPGDFGDLVKSLLNIVNKDTNIIVVTLAVKILGQLATGLGTKYSAYAQQTVAACLGKFKERKATLVSALKVTIDAAAKSVSMESMLEDIVAALGHKTPGVRAETAAFLSRLFNRCSPAILSKKVLKALVPPLCETSKDTNGEVRESSFAALGTAMRVVGSKNIEPFLGELDAIRMGKIKEYCEQAAASGEKSESAPAQTRPGTAPASSASAKPRRAPPPVQRPTTAAKETPSESGDTVSESKPSAKKPASSKEKTIRSTTSTQPTVPTENMLSDEQIVEKGTELFGEDLMNQLVSNEWKERLAGINELQQRCQTMGLSTLPTQVTCRVLMRKPGLKDTNVQVLRVRMDLLHNVLAASTTVSSNLTELLLPDLLDKIGDVKLGELIKTVLTVLSERSSFPLVGEQILKSVFQVKNPRSQAELLNWISLSVREFGMKLPSKEVIATIRTGLNAINPAVRQASLQLAGSIHLFMGDAMRDLLADEKPAVLTLLNAEFDKNAGQRPPAPTRGLPPKGACADHPETADDADVETIAEEELDSEALIPRVDICPKLTSDILNLLSSKSWKERQEGLNKIQEVLSSAKHIEGSNGALQEPLSAVAKVCSDANKNLSKLALTVLRDFALAMPKPDAAKYVRYVEPSILLVFGDTKPQLREAANAALTAWQSRVPFVALVENDMLSDALKTENAFLRADLLRWLNEALTPLPSNCRRQLPAEFGDNLMPCVFAAMEDRNPDARKHAQAVLPQLIRVLGWETIAKAAGRLKTTSKDAVMPHLEKAKESVMVKESSSAKAPTAPVKKVTGGQRSTSMASSGTTADDTEESTSQATSTTTAVRGGKKKPDGKKSTTSAPSAKKPPPEEPPVGAPLQANKAAKSARLAEEKKRKLLKWDFDTPTREHTQQLNQLFLSAGASPELHSLLFHSDFRQYLKAIDILNQFLDTPEGQEATVLNVDLILRWVVLRFFETNPVVLGRCIEYVNKLFARMSEAGQTLSEHEANAFLPYLVIKSGDPKDAIRNGIGDLFRIVVNIYPPQKLFAFLTNGIKSKSNKTRQECLKEMGSLIERFGMSVCQPSVSVAVKSIAQQIGDRDSEVRSAALNALVFAHALMGEQMWKMLGTLPDKDRSMLEERIKRAVVQPISSAPDLGDSGRPTSKPQSARQPREHSDTRQPLDTARFANRPQVEQISAAQQRARQMLSELGDLSPEKPPKMPDLIALDADISDLFKPIEIPTLKTHSRQPVLDALLRASPDTASAVTMVVTAISSNDLLVSCHALAELDTVLRDEKWYLLLNHVNQILMLITMQLRQVTTRYFGDPAVAEEQLRTLIRCQLATLNSLFQRPTLAREVSRETLRELFQALLRLMLDERTTTMPDGDNVIRAINSLCMLVIKSSNATRILSALIHLLHESVSNDQYTNRFTQSILKSIWRITKGMDSTEHPYSLDIVLLDCHHFLKAFPTASWKNRPSDVPIRTVKTMLHVLCKLHGSSILDFLESVPNREDSELESYLNRTLQTLGGGTTGTKSRVPSGSRGLKSGISSAATREKLTEIFKKVGSKSADEAVEGLNELYDFTQNYPEMDLGVFLAKTSQFFQTYIKQALRNIAVERSKQSAKQSAHTGADGDVERGRRPQHSPLGPLDNDLSTEPSSARLDPLPTDLHNVDPKIFMNRLAQLRRELGLGGVSTTNVDEGPDWSVVANGNDEGVLRNAVLENTLRSMVSPQQDPAQEQQPPVEQTDSDQPRPTMSAQELLDIKRRLERIKSGLPI